MADVAQQRTTVKGLWKRFLLLIPLIAVITIAARLYIGSQIGSLVVTTRVSYDQQTFARGKVTLSKPGIVEVKSVEQVDGRARVTFVALSDGETSATFGTDDVRDWAEHWQLTVKGGAVIGGGIDFSGWESIHVGMCVVLAAAAVLFASALVELRRASWYGYTMVACGGGLLFTLFQFAFFTFLLLDGTITRYSMFVTEITHMAQWFAFLSMFPVGLLAVTVSISNISLIRHEGFRPVNLLGIMVSVVWGALNLLWLTWGNVLYSLPFDVASHVDSLVAVAITFGECLLLSTMLCAWLASRHVPKHGADYIIVLGCGIRADGTPCPLLAGRVNKAVDFDKARVAAGDAPATFVPSGGQGPDEPISEAQSMSDYLVGQCGMEPSRIALEDRSTTTQENMVFSREVIQKHAGVDASELKVVFSTTNYHVFRGYVCAHQAGMSVEGVGSKTKLYFWPNAFLREFAGLLVNQWKGILQTYLVISLIYILAEYSLVLV